MISFRFHIVSLIAVFLAVAIGVVVGSTYVDGAVVSGLRNRIATVSHNLDQRRELNDKLENDLGAARGYIESSADFAVTERLADVPVFLLATRGVDEGVVESAARLARRAGADLPGVVWLEPTWSLENPDRRRELATLLGVPAATETQALWSTAWTSVSRQLASPTAVAPAQPQADLLAALAEGGFLTVDSLDEPSKSLSGLLGANPRVMVISGSRAHEDLVQIVPVVVGSLSSARLPVVLGDIYVEQPDGPARGVTLRDAIPAEVRESIAVVDHLDQLEGRVSAVLALSALVDGPAGHFGYGARADAVLPSWTPP